MDVLEYLFVLPGDVTSVRALAALLWEASLFKCDLHVYFSAYLCI